MAQKHELRHADLIARMSNEEKAALLSGRNEWETWPLERLGVPSIFLADGPHGLRKQAGAGDHLGLNPSLPATCFPTTATVANSWDVGLAEEVGAALGQEARSLGVDVVLGPGLNIKRSPLGGRNFEYFSEDPLLSGKMAAAYVRGIQSQGPSACPKHFAVNSQETSRMSVNEVVDERALREIYLRGFEIAVREGAARSIMTSYNKVNDTYANENEHLLVDILRDEWGYEGAVITDWGGSNDHVRAIACRSNLEMPTPGLDSARQVLAALEDGRLSEDQLDQCVDDLLELVLRCSAARSHGPEDLSAQEHHELARRTAAESAVLLKNDAREGRPLLPLDPDATVALVGDFARTPRYQGAGSSLVNPLEVETMERVASARLRCIGCVQGYRRGADPDVTLEEEAVRLARQADVVVICMGLDEISEVEGMDRRHLRIPEAQIALLEKLARANPSVIAILSGGSPIEMEWESSCAAILHGYLGGQAGASAMLDVLMGAVCPSGHLAETYPLALEDTPCADCYPGQDLIAQHRESVFVGYRYYETTDAPVRYPFGYGLSYTTFSYSSLEVESDRVLITLTNTGVCDGAEVAQVYSEAPAREVFRPKRELIGFAKVFLRAGESRRVSVSLDEHAFDYWNVRTSAWERERGTHRVLVGSSVRDIRLEGAIKLSGTDAPAPYTSCELPHYWSGNIHAVTKVEFEALLGRTLPEPRTEGPLDINDSVAQMSRAKSVLARLVWRVLTRRMQKTEQEGTPDLNLLFVYNIPFRAIAKMTGGQVSMEMAEGLLDAVNGHLLRGMHRLVVGYTANRRADRAYERRLKEY